MAELLLIASLCGERVALPASRIESVVEIESITPVPRAAGHIAGLTALRSRVLTVIDCAASIERGGRVDDRRDALVAVVDGHPYALLVDRIEDVVEAEGEGGAIPPGLSPGWARIASAYLPASGGLVLLADVDALIAGPAAA
jgi:purine-binding chemotaxis protein CheW